MAEKQFYVYKGTSIEGVDTSEFETNALITKKQFSDNIQENYAWNEESNYTSDTQLIYDGEMTVTQDEQLKKIILVNNDSGLTSLKTYDFSDDEITTSYNGVVVYNLNTDKSVTATRPAVYEYGQSSLAGNGIYYGPDSLSHDYLFIGGQGGGVANTIANYIDLSIQYSTNKNSSNQYFSNTNFYVCDDTSDESQHEYPTDDDSVNVYLHYVPGDPAHVNITAESTQPSSQFHIQHQGNHNMNFKDQNSNDLVKTTLGIYIYGKMFGKTFSKYIDIYVLTVAIASVKFAKKISRKAEFPEDYNNHDVISNNLLKNLIDTYDDNHTDNSTYYYSNDENLLYVYDDEPEFGIVYQFYGLDDNNKSTIINNGSYDRFVLQNDVIYDDNTGYNISPYTQILYVNTYNFIDFTANYYDIKYVSASYIDLNTPYDIVDENSPGNLNIANSSYTEISFIINNNNLRSLKIYTKKAIPQLVIKTTDGLLGTSNMFQINVLTNFNGEIAYNIINVKRDNTVLTNNTSASKHEIGTATINNVQNSIGTYRRELINHAYKIDNYNSVYPYYYVKFIDPQRTNNETQYTFEVYACFKPTNTNAVYTLEGATGQIGIEYTIDWNNDGAITRKEIQMSSGDASAKPSTFWDE